MTTESEKFDQYEQEWWNPAGKLFSLHRINPLRFGYFSGHAGELNNARVLDVGCGGGLLAERFADAGASVTGIDLSPVAIAAAKKHAASSGLTIDYRVASPSAITEKDGLGLFDIIVCAEVLEHVDDLETFLAATLTMLKPNGLFFFGTINKTLKARLLAIAIAEDILHMVPRGTHDFKRFIRPSILKEILRKNNVEMLELKGMSYDPLRLEFRLSNDTSVNYLGYAKKKG
ncbi:MAG: bifunctional 2-polyprenyl-6-hydroxyphenol methylase/3-demethylubiquinol 3-O-methyltransferase UbiG [Deltaproteobacteria bacterium]|nr:bifunctional 2-polyprenyl-6-hydroxyphenol methylase/3-demethylubiquinol 3-O-methyltransferase UbiG [Deltaproteobacteria bacterium]